MNDQLDRAIETNQPVAWIKCIEQMQQLLPKIHGWCGPEKAALLMTTIFQNKPKVCVEIGVFGGSSLFPQAMALKLNGHGTICGIDPWSKEAALEEMIGQEHKDWWSKVDLGKIRDDCFAWVEKLELRGRVLLLQLKSEEAVGQFQDDSVDLLHIDGNHSEVLAMKDATLWLPKVKTGGHIFFDDIHWAEARPGEEAKPTTAPAIMFLQRSCDPVELVGDCMLLRKR